MAIPKCVRIMVRGVADGTSEQFSVDLATDPYWVGSDSAAGYGGTIVNWLAETPTDVMLIGGALSANMVGAGSTVVTIDVPVKDAGYVYEVVLEMIVYGEA